MDGLPCFHSSSVCPGKPILIAFRRGRSSERCGLWQSLGGQGLWSCGPGRRTPSKLSRCHQRRSRVIDRCWETNRQTDINVIIKEWQKERMSERNTDGRMEGRTSKSLFIPWAFGCLFIFTFMFTALYYSCLILYNASLLYLILLFKFLPVQFNPVKT